MSKTRKLIAKIFMASWLTLQEYSNKQGLSISTLRRKIKGREIEYTFKNGRYLLKAPEEKESLISIKELKNHYQKILNEKDKNIQKLKEEREDLLHLLDFLEKEKAELLKHLENKENPFI